MQATPVKRILIVGGGTAGWMTAAALAHKFAALPIEIRLVESEQIGTIGVGEATVPHIRFFNAALGIDEAEFMRSTSATFKLGIEFRDWGRLGDSYVHPFGAFGTDSGDVPFLQHWIRARADGGAPPLDQCSLPVQAARLDRFGHPANDPQSIFSTFSYAYQFDAGLYGRFLRAHAERNSVERIEGRIVDVALRGDDGLIESVELEGGRRIDADLFIDCSGFRGLLIEQALKSGFDSWAHWLPCDRAIAVPCEGHGPLTPYTRVTAQSSGWIWRIPLQHRVGNGHVYSSAFTDDDAAQHVLMSQLEAAALGEPNRLRFNPGKRPRQWIGNCVAIGLSAGFLEPLESTSIHFIQIAIERLIELFPDGGFDPADAAEFNRTMGLEYERVRDFLILHYCATERDDSAFWNYCRTMPLPDSLTEKIELFRERGVVADYRVGMFLEPSWIAVYVGQGIVPGRHSAIAESMSGPELKRLVAATAQTCRQAAERMPMHAAYLQSIGASVHNVPND